MTQVVEYLPRKHKALSLNPRTSPKNKHLEKTMEEKINS
jgi:hypothetical protein